MFFATYVFLLESYADISMIIPTLPSVLDFFIDVEGIVDNVNFYPEILQGYKPVLFVFQTKEPVIIPTNIKVSSLPWDLKLSDETIRRYFYSHPSLLLVSEYETDYSHLSLNTDMLKDKFPELYQELTVNKKLRF